MSDDSHLWLRPRSFPARRYFVLGALHSLAEVTLRLNHGIHPRVPGLYITTHANTLQGLREIHLLVIDPYGQLGINEDRALDHLCRQGRVHAWSPADFLHLQALSGKDFSEEW